jgi:hypothetical protein
LRPSRRQCAIEAGLCAGHYRDWAPRVIAGSSVSGEDGARRASAILARARRRDVRPNIWASLCSQSGLPAWALSRHAATAASYPRASARRTDSNQARRLPGPASPSMSSARGPRGTESRNADTTAISLTADHGRLMGDRAGHESRVTGARPGPPPRLLGGPAAGTHDHRKPVLGRRPLRAAAPGFSMWSPRQRHLARMPTLSNEADMPSVARGGGRDLR